MGQSKSDTSYLVYTDQLLYVTTYILRTYVQQLCLGQSEHELRNGIIIDY